MGEPWKLCKVKEASQTSLHSVCFYEMPRVGESYRGRKQIRVCLRWGVGSKINYGQKWGCFLFRQQDYSNIDYGHDCTIM